MLAKAPFDEVMGILLVAGWGLEGWEVPGTAFVVSGVDEFLDTGGTDAGGTSAAKVALLVGRYFTTAGTSRPDTDQG